MNHIGYERRNPTEESNKSTKLRKTEMGERIRRVYVIYMYIVLEESRVLEKAGMEREKKRILQEDSGKSH